MITQFENDLVAHRVRSPTSCGLITQGDGCRVRWIRVAAGQMGNKKMTLVRPDGQSEGGLGLSVNSPPGRGPHLEGKWGKPVG
jgi:hypothetical protein